MILVDKKHDAELIALAPSIRNYVEEWQIVNINILKTSRLSRKDIIERLLNQYEKTEGLLYPLSEAKIVMLVRFGQVNSFVHIKAEIEEKLPKHCCRIMMHKVNAAGIQQIQMNLMERDDGGMFFDEGSLYEERVGRRDNAIMVADDDKFIRAAMLRLLRGYGEVVEVESGEDVMSQYLRCNPDIVFVDIHLPGKNGLELVDEIINLDADAFIIVLSSDSSAENVMKALQKGALGFLSKPPAKHKVQEYIGQCITIR